MLVVKVFMIIHLSIVLEDRKKSIPFLIDIVFKQIGLIFFSCILYAFIFLSAKVFENFFITILGHIDNNRYETL